MMEDKAWGKIWGVVGLAALVFGWAAAARSRGLDAKTSVAVDVGSILPVASSILSFLVLFALTILTVEVTIRFAMLHLNDGWFKRVPIAFLSSDEIDPSSRDGKAYQAILFIAFSILPILFLFFVFVQFSDAPTYRPDGKLFENGWANYMPTASPTWKWLSGLYRFGDPKGPSYYPVFQPWLYLSMLGLTAVRCAVMLQRVFRTAPSVQAEAAEPAQPI
jgi:hypothetical protein